MELVQFRRLAAPTPAPTFVCTEDNAAQVPADTYAGPASVREEEWEPAMVHAMTLAQLKQGDWPANQVIGARIKTFPFELKTWLNAGGSVTPREFKNILDRSTFTSLNGTRLQPQGRLPTGWGTASKWYFVKAENNGRVYAFRDSLWRSTAKKNACHWAAHLALRAHGQEQFVPLRLDDNGFVMSTKSSAAKETTPGGDWFCFDLMGA